MNQQQRIDKLAGARPDVMPWKWRLLWMLIFYGPAGYCFTQGDYVLAAVIGFTGLAAFSGFRIGAIAIAASLAGIAAAITYAPELGIQQEWRLTEWFGTTGLLNRLIAIGSAGLLIGLAVLIVTQIVCGQFLRRHPSMNRSNRWLGFGVGTAEGLLAMLFLLGGVLVLEPIERERTANASVQSPSVQRLSTWVVVAAEHTRRSNIGPWIEAYNPLVRYPELNQIEEIRKSVVVLSDPSKIQQVIDHPDVQKLRQRPDVQAAYEQVMQDPRIRAALYSGQKMSKSTALLLLNHPALLRLIDQPGFVAAARQTIRNTQLRLSGSGI